MSERILSKHDFISNDTRVTRLNNNDCIIGASGSGKTGGYVVPNIEIAEESVIIADTKGRLHKRYAGLLSQRGYKVRLLDFANFKRSCGYNPLSYIEGDARKGIYSEKDIMSIANSLLPITDKNDPFWEESARMVLASMIALVMEIIEPANRNLVSVREVFRIMTDTGNIHKVFSMLEAQNPESFAVRKYKGYRDVLLNTDTTWQCILRAFNNTMGLFDFEGANEMFGGRRELNLVDIGRKKMAVFVNISDTDRTFDRLVNIFYTQVLMLLCREADRRKEKCLKVPVRIIMDDFANNVVIPDFDKIISVIRSRDISVSIVLQSISQLVGNYTNSQAVTILNNCDHILYLGGSDISTAEFISQKANKPLEDILNMELDKAYLFERGSVPRIVEKIEVAM